jgi:hypothetical protein
MFSKQSSEEPLPHRKEVVEEEAVVAVEVKVGEVEENCLVDQIQPSNQ